MTYIPGIGPSTAKLMILGDCARPTDVRTAEPFSGQNATILEECFDGTGISLAQVYRSYVIKTVLANDQSDNLIPISEKYYDQLTKEIEALQPNCILALGEVALKFCTGLYNIGNWRGSILRYRDYKRKVVPSINPGTIFGHEKGGLRDWKDLTYVKWDFARAVEESKSSAYLIPKRNLICARNSSQLLSFFERYQDANKVAIDIETFKTIPICIAFAFSRNEAISVPFFRDNGDPDWPVLPQTDQAYIWQFVSRLLANSDIMKIGMNYKFDQGQLEYANNKKDWFGMPTSSVFFDIRLGFKTLYPELPASLAFIQSVLTREPFHKNEGKEYHPKKDKFDRLLLYNAKDAAVTYECYEEIMRELEERNLKNFFLQYQMPLYEVYRKMENRGILIDQKVREELNIKYDHLIEDEQDKLDALTAIFDLKVNAKSPKQVAALLFDHLKVPIRKGTDEKTLDALVRGDALKANPRAKAAIASILELRGLHKAKGTYINFALINGRAHTSYNLMLETGRTSTTVVDSPIMLETHGVAFQTITKHSEIGHDIRKQFIPDPGFIFIEADKAQAEARVVARMSNDKNQEKLFKFKVDVHRVMAAMMDSIEPDELLAQFFLEDDYDNCWRLASEINKILKSLITENQRQAGKKSVHAANYDMGKHQAAIDLKVSEWRAKQFLDKVHRAKPNIRGVFHEGIKKALKDNSLKLMNPFGRERQFLNKWGPDLFKEAYAQIPQSTISDHVKQHARVLTMEFPPLQILQEAHDSLLMQCRPEHLNEAIERIKIEFERPINFEKCSLGEGEIIIPCDIKIGDKDWESMKEIK
jgi:uracil-DNA glycosylase family 4